MLNLKCIGSHEAPPLTLRELTALPMNLYWVLGEEKERVEGEGGEGVDPYQVWEQIDAYWHVLCLLSK